MENKFFLDNDENLSEDLLSEGAQAKSVTTCAKLTSNMSCTSFQMKSKEDFNERLLKNKTDFNKPKSDTNLLTSYIPLEADKVPRSPLRSMKICGSPFCIDNEDNLEAPTPKFDRQVPMKQSISGLLKQAIRIRKRSRARTHIQKLPKGSNTSCIAAHNKVTNKEKRVITMEDVHFGS
ncbi:unnamed protein product [Moneuplotes crassus]|uniref:Uncharacterized protein n=1 Tax=Euplotes crassus TaxID=5936 RepID=A0AAD1Y9F2_EUPCR|nr:unnamed protein product [Moneuplotes crassus]